VPIEFYNRNVDDILSDKLGLKRNSCRIHKYRDIVEKCSNYTKTTNIAVFGKYDNCDEAYISLKEAIFHAALANNLKVNVCWVNAEILEMTKDVPKFFININGIIVPGGFDRRGIEGKIKAIQYAREHKIPFLGICLGLQCAAIEFARNVLQLKEANSQEFNKNTPHPVVHFVEGQQNVVKKSATMRLGAYDCELNKDSLSYVLYDKKLISERHRHRYEVNNDYVKQFEDNGFMAYGKNPNTNLVEIMELDKKIHPFFIGTQFHGEFNSKLIEPAPLFKGLIAAAVKNN
jgi:CTP synthase